MVQSRMKIKVLQLDWWMKSLEDIIEDDRIIKIPPILNRHGQYLVKDFAWFECEHGCYTYQELAKMIKYDLDLWSQRPLRDKEVECIRYLIRERIAPKALREMYYRDKCWKEIRNTGRMTRKAMLGWLKDEGEDRTDNSVAGKRI